MQKLGLKILNITVFIILCALGVLFLLASPVDPARMLSRTIVGSILIFSSILSLILISLLIHRNENDSANYIEIREPSQDKDYYPKEVVCPECGSLIKITDDLQVRQSIYCEQCGKEIQIPKDNLKW